MKGVSDACPAALQTITFLKYLNPKPTIQSQILANKQATYASLTSHVVPTQIKKKEKKKRKSNGKDVKSTTNQG